MFLRGVVIMRAQAWPAICHQPRVAKSAPAGSDVAVAAVKSMLAAANSAYDNLTKVTKQATEIAEANVNAATETVKGLAKAKKAA